MVSGQQTSPLYIVISNFVVWGRTSAWKGAPGSRYQSILTSSTPPNHSQRTATTPLTSCPNNVGSHAKSQPLLSKNEKKKKKCQFGHFGMEPFNLQSCHHHSHSLLLVSQVNWIDHVHQMVLTPECWKYKFLRSMTPKFLEGAWQSASASFLFLKRNVFCKISHMLKNFFTPRQLDRFSNWEGKLLNNGTQKYLKYCPS